jgi:hypothetical protein
MSSSRPSAAWRTAALALALGTVTLVAPARPSQPAAGTLILASGSRDALMGELVFQADLLHALDRLCGRVTPGPDWHAALAEPVQRWLTPELRDLSRRLGRDAGTQLVRDNGGCRSRAFEAAYGQSRDEFETLLDRFDALSQ